MSAFAAFKPTVADITIPLPKPLPDLLDSMATSSSFKHTCSNSIFKSESLILGLKTGEYLIFRGQYFLKVLRGIVLINNINALQVGNSYSIYTNTCESLPIISSNPVEEIRDILIAPKFSLLPEFDTVIEVLNLDDGLCQIGDLYPTLEGHFYPRQSQYTFNLVESDDMVSSIFFNSYSHRILSKISRECNTVAVFGVPTSGKTIVAKTLLNNALSQGRKEVAYLDLDVGSSNAYVPGCISVSIHCQPILGSIIPNIKNPHSMDKHCYWGFDTFLNMPQRYIDVCMKLITHYKESIEPYDIPLIVRYPSCIKGYGRGILVQLTEYLLPDHLIYLSHNNANELDGFEPDAFEAQDNPDTEVLAEFKAHVNVSVLRATRKAIEMSKTDLLNRNKLLYFHQSDEGFDFLPVLSNPPLKLSFNNVIGFSVLDYKLDLSLLCRIDVLAEATIMGLFIYNGKTNPYDLYLNGEDFIAEDNEFICLCMVHSVDRKDKHFNLYIPNREQVSERIQMLVYKKKLVLARGEGKIPFVDLIPATENGLDLPYVDSSLKKRIGGVWKPRRGISRKNQG